MKNIKLKCNSLNTLIETIQSLILKENVSVLKSPLLEANGEFTSVVQTKDDFDPSQISSNVFADEEKNEESEEDAAKKTDLLNKAKDEIKKSLDTSENLKDILKQIQDLNKEDDGLRWVKNEEDNTARLNNKDAQIFIQNNRICLSYNNKVHLFDSVEELHDYLKKHGMPLPKGIKLHESTLTEDEVSNSQDKEIAFNNQENSPNNVDSERDAFDQAIRNRWGGLSEIAYNIIFDKANIDRLYNEYKAEQAEKAKQDQSSSTENLTDTTSETTTDEVSECFGGVGTSVANLGSAVQYTANKPLKENDTLKQTIDGIFDKFKQKKSEVLTEDETPADFASGNAGSSININSGDTTTGTDTTTPDLDMAGGNATQSNDTDAMNDLAGPDMGGDVNINMPSLDYSPEGEEDQADPSLVEPEPEYEIIDVLMNTKDNSEIRVKVRNLDTGDIEIKPLSEIDV